MDDEIIPKLTKCDSGHGSFHFFMKYLYLVFERNRNTYSDSLNSPRIAFGFFRLFVYNFMVRIRTVWIRITLLANFSVSSPFIISSPQCVYKYATKIIYYRNGGLGAARANNSYNTSHDRIKQKALLGVLHWRIQMNCRRSHSEPYTMCPPGNCRDTEMTMLWVSKAFCIILPFIR